MTRQLESRAPGLVLLAIGAAFVIGGRSYSVTLDGRMGPGLVPVVTGSLLVLLGGCLAWVGEQRPLPGGGADDGSSALGDGVATAGAGQPDTGALQTDPVVRSPALGFEDEIVEHPARPWVILGLMTASLLLTSLVGLLAALALMTIALMRFVEKESWRMALGVTVGVVGGSWLVFVQLLSVPLPTGIFGGS